MKSIKDREKCLVEYPIMLISGGETYLKLIFEKEDGCAEVVELSLNSSNSFPCVQKSIQFSNEKHCVVFEKRGFKMKNIYSLGDLRSAKEFLLIKIMMEVKLYGIMEAYLDIVYI